MMQSRRWEHGSSGELDVFGATSYFAGLPPAPDDDDNDNDDCASCLTEPIISADRRLYFQVHHDTTKKMVEGNSFRGPRQQQQLAGFHADHAAERHASNNQLQLQVVTTAKRQQHAYSGKSELAALLSFMVSPSPLPRASSFRKEKKKNKKQEAPSTTTTTLLRQAEAAASAAAGGEKSPSSRSSRESSMRLQGLLGAAHDGGELDLGVATGDRRLQGITVVRGGGGGGEERWVVRCVPGGACWDDEEHREKMLDAEESAAAASSEQNIKVDELVVEVQQLGDDDDDDDDDDGNVDPAHSWDSDSSSDLFDLDLEYK